MTLPRSRPKITDEQTDKMARFFFDDGKLPAVVVFGVRGYFLNSMGKPGENDFNLYDDAWLVYENGNLVKTFNANTDPSKHKANLAWLNTGVYQFYKGKHRNRIAAFRAYPEGVKWRCKRQRASGELVDAWCSHINIHDGGKNNTWSEGCQTSYQFVEFRELVYGLMSKHKEKLLTYVLLDEKQMNEILADQTQEHQERATEETKTGSLKIGAKGEAVKTLQTALVENGFMAKAQIDSTFGKKTEQALQRFQLQNGLIADGIAGKDTYKALGLD